MSDYACAKCGSTGFVGELRMVSMFAGPGKELQAAGIAPIRRCQKCDELTVQSQLNIGEHQLNLQPIPPKLPPENPAAAQKKQIADMKAALAQLEGQASAETRKAMDGVESDLEDLGAADAPAKKKVAKKKVAKKKAGKKKKKAGKG